MVGTFVSVIVCSLHMPEKNAHRDGPVCCSSVCVSSRTVGQILIKFCVIICHWRSPQIDTFQFISFVSSTLADALCATTEML
jgi:hypothetical protein